MHAYAAAASQFFIRVVRAPGFHQMPLTSCKLPSDHAHSSKFQTSTQHFPTFFSNFFKLLETLRASAAEPQHKQHSVSACDQVSYTGPP